MTIKPSRHNRASLRQLLVEGYDCKFLGFLGDQIPPPYVSSDEGPDYFLPPNGGEAFIVPLAMDENGFYYEWVVDRVINNNKLIFVKPASIEDTSSKESAVNE